MMGHKGQMKSGSEYDAFTKWRRFLHWRAGQRKAIKRAFSRRMRRMAKLVKGARAAVEAD